MTRRYPSRPARMLAWTLAGALTLIAASAGGTWLYLRASLPQLDGRMEAVGIGHPVSIARDAIGNVTIRADDRLDAAFATGFAHAQDRFFQMDLVRRSAAGELAALVGDAALPLDRRVRVHRFRARAERAYAELPAPHRALLERYAEGANAGLDRLPARPFEYVLLRTRPEPWRPVDTLLAIYAMYLDLQGGELGRTRSREALDDKLAEKGAGLSVRRASSRLLAVMEDLVRAQAWKPAYAADWREFMLERLDTAIAEMTIGGQALETVRWGDRNRLAIAHPLARVLPRPLQHWLSAPSTPMPGDIHMPRIQGAAFGASERFVVSPGREARGILQMPGGASGHPLSPFFLAGHDAWVHGKASPFLPGPDAHRLTLVPRAPAD